VLYAERHRASYTQAGHALGGRLHVLRNQVASGADDEILAAAGDVKLALRHVAQIAGEEPSVLQNFPGRLRIAEVSLHDAGALDGDLADHARPHRTPLGVDHAHRQTLHRRADRGEGETGRIGNGSGPSLALKNFSIDGVDPHAAILWRK